MSKIVLKITVLNNVTNGLMLLFLDDRAETMDTSSLWELFTVNDLPF